MTTYRFIMMFRKSSKSVPHFVVGLHCWWSD